jgi:hypothetical protein
MRFTADDILQFSVCAPVVGVLLFNLYTPAKLIALAGDFYTFPMTFVSHKFLFADISEFL